jgi:hypothetical protein
MANVAGFEHHELTFRMPTDAAACLRCRRLLTLDDLGTPRPGPPPGRAPAEAEPGIPA